MSPRATRVLVTAFEPFNGSVENASLAVLSRLTSASWPVGIDLRHATLPVETHRIAGVLVGLLEQHTPGVVVLLGESAQAECVTLERLAVNLRDFGIADNAGAQPEDEPVEVGGPEALWSTLPVKACRARVRASGGDAALSLSAGAYLCNQALYVALRWSAVAGAGRARRVGFVHVPSLPSQVARGERRGAGLPASDSAAAVREIVLAAAAADAESVVDNPAKY